ncbi:MAG: hypothetical protein IPM74_03665 [Crocinitomicaceae bacterium]|nr:hypothetical protein [Crocinitomicaceae bacterium]MBK8925011.1 hypothetical protein [Crocinitomicaceae bacterium]
MKLIFVYLFVFFLTSTGFCQSNEKEEFEASIGTSEIQPGYYSRTFKWVPDDPLLVFFNKSKPPETVTDPQAPLYALKMPSDSSKKILVGFYALQPNNRHQTAVIGILFTEISDNIFKPVCVDTFPMIENKYGASKIRIESASIIQKDTTSLSVQISYNGGIIDSQNGGATHVTYTYVLPENFDELKQLKLYSKE